MLSIAETVRNTDIVSTWNTNWDLYMYTPSTQQCHFEWPWLLEWLSELFNDTERTTSLCDSWASCKLSVCDT